MRETASGVGWVDWDSSMSCGIDTGGKDYAVKMWYKRDPQGNIIVHRFEIIDDLEMLCACGCGERLQGSRGVRRKYFDDTHRSRARDARERRVSALIAQKYGGKR